jgi:rhodanese-related sulfurtransferase
MRIPAKLTFIALGFTGLAALGVWWLADHRRGIAWAISVVRARFPDVQHLSPSSVERWLRDSARTPPQLVDARSKEEFDVSHLTGALRIGPESTTSAVLNMLDPNRSVLVYCSAGYRGATLARRLQNAGRRDVWNLEGGIFAWANSGFPLERDGQHTQRVHPYLRIFSRLLKRLKAG